MIARERVLRAILLLVLPAVGFATEVRHGRLTSVPDPQVHAEELALDVRARFLDRLERYAADIAEVPYDVTAHVDRCRFIEQVSYDYEYLAWADEVFDRHTRCVEELAQQFPGHPEVELYRLERMYGNERLEAAAELLPHLDHRGFTTEQAARLYALLATVAESADDESAGKYAIRALELDQAADVRLVAAEHLVRSGEQGRAIEILTSPFDGHGPDEGWYVVRKMQILAELGAHEEVRKLYASLRRGGAGYNHFEAARALAMTGAPEAARAEFERAEHWSTDDERARFRFEMEHGTSAQALAAYETLRERGWTEDPLAINRIALFVRDPLLGWNARDFLGFAALAGTAAALALIVLVPLSLAHYRGLARRARHGGTVATDGWQLRHAWAALFGFGLASVLSLYTAGPLSLVDDEAAFQGIDATDGQLARIIVCESFLVIAFLLPLLRRARVRQPAAWTTRWTFAKSAIAGALVGILLRIPFFVLLGVDPESVTSLAALDSVWQQLALVSARYGPAAAFWIVAIAAPVVEEFVFRGVLLRALSGHIAFGWANIAQAALFAAVHLDPSVFPVVFVLGLCAGWLVRQSGGLLAPLVLHATFNLVAALVIL